MSLPTLKKFEKRPKGISLRLSEQTVKQLKKLAHEHNLSQADVITLLVEQEFQKSSKHKATDRR